MNYGKSKPKNERREEPGKLRDDSVSSSRIHLPLFQRILFLRFSSSFSSANLGDNSFYSLNLYIFCCLRRSEIHLFTFYQLAFCLERSRARHCFDCRFLLDFHDGWFRLGSHRIKRGLNAMLLCFFSVMFFFPLLSLRGRQVFVVFSITLQEF